MKIGNMTKVEELFRKSDWYTKELATFAMEEFFSCVKCDEYFDSEEDFNDGWHCKECQTNK